MAFDINRILNYIRTRFLLHLTLLLFLFLQLFLSLHFRHDLFQRLDRFRFLTFEPLEIDTFDKLWKRSFPDLLPVVVYLAESLVDDMLFLQAAFKMCNRNPLGSAAGYGSSFPLNRTMTTRLLGFDSLNYNVVYAQMGRGKMERNVAFALASIAGTVSKLAFDACMFNSQNFGFVKLPDDCNSKRRKKR